jgi:L-ascorbate metabolism protein UlaG (beta-lactamase superfamily)
MTTDPRTTTLRFTYIGGPTALLEFGGLRLLTDPGFDPGGTVYELGVYTLRKTAGPALRPEDLGPIDAVLLSHDHHMDNLDRAGRAMLPAARSVLTTQTGAQRLGLANATGLLPWQTADLPAPDGRTLRVTATPARHGPEGGDRGPVIGFVLSSPDSPDPALYISGDTVWYDGVAEVARRFPTLRAAVLFMGAARVKEVGPQHLTLTATEGVEVARTMPNATILPLHYDGWAHFSEGRPVIEAAFATAGLGTRLVWGEPGRAVEVPLG